MDITEKAASELVEQAIKWQDSAQVLAYLIGGVNGLDAEDTLRVARARLAKLFEQISFEVSCWKEIEQRDNISEDIRAFASARVESLTPIVDKSFERFQKRTEGR